LAVERAIGCVKLNQKETNDNESEENSLDLDIFYIEVDDFKKASKRVKPSAQREGFSTVPSTTW